MLGSHPARGLSSAEAEARLKEQGRNELIGPSGRRPGWARRGIRGAQVRLRWAMDHAWSEMVRGRLSALQAD